MWWCFFIFPTVLALRDIEPPPPTPVTRNTPIESWLTVRLNHFDASNTETFQMRYLYNDELANSTNIVIFVGGEWAISPGWLTGGLAFELAESAQAALFYTEHRYYGLTRPTSETSVHDLRYLNVDQALGDLAQFIQHVRSDSFENGRYRNGSVALVGCSYAGSMATWMRLAYPHLVTVALSDSGPLHAQENFPEYLEVITEALRSQGSEACVTSIEDAMRNITALLATPAGVQRVSQLFNTCGPLEASSPLDLATFYWFGITETFAYLVQYATPGDIPSACNRITNSTISSDPVERLASWITSQSTTQPCIESRYSVQVAAHTNTSYDSPQATMRLWTYQTCVEYGWYQTTTSSRQPFLSTVPLEYFHQMCTDFFPNLFDTALLRSGIARTNKLFAGLTHLPDHVISVSGGHDPWAPMAPNTTHATHLAPVFVVPDVSHCRAIRATNNSETEELENTKRRILQHMDRLMTGRTESGASNIILSPILLVFGILYLVL
ncbi:putative serine protease K12H4.7 [Maniola jurtina]|uniref:putative serine protease K12H4.7 n=1 Tax=Maniola jurtina TaxID=191418 RepID=UPI001E68DAEB|nr:putative serine protease K12H4.7 [Maniola jurtina]